MEITNKAQLLEFIRQQSLKLLKENEAFAHLEEKLKDIDESFIQVNEKRFEKLKSEEEKAVGDENYVELQRIKQDKLVVLKKLIDSYKYKTRIFEQIQDSISQELQSLGVQGNSVFKNKEIHEFNNEDFQKGQTLKINTISSEISLEKISDNNQYQILNTTAEGLKSGDVLVVPNTKVGSSIKVSVYRKDTESGRFEEIGKPTLQNIKSITKNPV